MFAGMAATGLPKDWRNALLLGRLDAGDGPLPVIVKNGRVRDVSRSTPTVSEFLNTWSGATLGALETKVTTSQQAPPWTLGIAALMRNLACRGLLPERQ